jgi:hypothetical protein
VRTAKIRVRHVFMVCEGFSIDSQTVIILAVSDYDAATSKLSAKM